MKNLILLILTLCFINARSQKLNPETISASSVSFENPVSSIAFTVGELVVETFVDSLTNGGSLGNGFTNSTVGSTQVNPLEVPSQELVMVNVYPNPTIDMVYIDLQKTKLSALTIQVIDINGKIISNEKFQVNNNHIGIKTDSWSSGNYFIHILSDNEKPVGVYQIFKK
jgi:hypothetical protein